MKRTLMATSAVLILTAGCAVEDDDATTTTTVAEATDDAESSDSSTGDAAAEEAEGTEETAQSDETANSTAVLETAPSGLADRYLGSYTLVDEEFGTEVTVTVADGVRTIVANAIPNHETGEFPNSGNPNTITEQSAEWSFPTVPVMTDTATTALTSGVALNGVKFEPGTAESIECATGERLRIEALQDLYDLGLDMNNAHVQPTGEYHYHGASSLLVDAFDNGEDLVHVGFAADGHLMVYSLSGAYPSGYSLSDEPRTGTDCQPSLRDSNVIDLEGTTPDGTYSSDWVHTPGEGVLDECNGIEIDGVYTYVITNEYPYISRCLFGEFTDVGPGFGAGPPTGGAHDGAPAPGR